MQGYRLKCREKRDMRDARRVTPKNGREARQGTCAVCGTEITVPGGAKAAEGVTMAPREPRGRAMWRA